MVGNHSSAILQKIKVVDVMGQAEDEEEAINYSKHNLPVIIGLSLIYGLLSLTALLGNVLVIWIIFTGRRMRTVMNIYIGNLALADVIIAVFYIPFQFQAALLNKWDLPAFMCKLCPFVQHVSINASIFTLVIIALDRYRGIIWPLRGGYSKLRAKVIVCLIWAASISPAVPNLIVFKVMDHPSGVAGVKGCLTDQAVWSDKAWRRYTLIMALLQYLVPLIILIISYGHMAKVLWVMTTPGQAHCQRDLAILANKKKVIKMLLIVVIMFGICWLPYQTFNLLSSLQFPLNFRGINYIWMASHILAMSNSCCNPFIYGIYNDKFSKEFRRKIASIFGQAEAGHLQAPAGDAFGDNYQHINQENHHRRQFFPHKNQLGQETHQRVPNGMVGTSRAGRKALNPNARSVSCPGQHRMLNRTPIDAEACTVIPLQSLASASASSHGGPKAEGPRVKGPGLKKNAQVKVLDPGAGGLKGLLKFKQLMRTRWSLNRSETTGSMLGPMVGQTHVQSESDTFKSSCFHHETASRSESDLRKLDSQAKDYFKRSRPQRRSFDNFQSLRSKKWGSPFPTEPSSY